MKDKCNICGCKLERSGEYATFEGRAHASRHHHIAQRFLKTKDKMGNKFQPTFSKCPWEIEKKTVLLCYECHEELIQNPVFLPKDIEKFKQLVKFRKLAENEKPMNRKKLAGRIILLNEVIETGIEQLLRMERKKYRVDGAERPQR